jgi:hypothetical protein
MMSIKRTFSLALLAGMLTFISSEAQAQQSPNGRAYISPQLRQQGRQIQQQYRTYQRETTRQLELRRQNTRRNVYVQRRWSDIPYNWAIGAARGGYVGALKEMVPDLYRSYRRQKQLRR